MSYDPGDITLVNLRGVRQKNVSALSEARFYKSVKSGEVLSARSVKP
jgi:hypothetical protein